MFQKPVVKNLDTFQPWQIFNTDWSNLRWSRRKAYWCKTVWTF